MKSAFYFLLAILAVQTVQAGDKILNGGNVIVCGNSVELLDYYEARLTGKKLQYDPNLNSYTEKLNQLFDRWKKVAPKRMALYAGWLNEFESESGIYLGIQIPDIPDTGSVVIPSECKMTPVAFQRRDEDIFPGEKRYMINKDLWDRMNEDQKAGLVLHELIYREAIKSAHPTSLPTRYFNSFLATEVNPENEKYFSVVYKMPLAWAEFGGMNIRIGQVNCNNGPFGNSGCNFNYSSRYESEKFELYVNEIFENIRTKDVSVDFYTYPCKLLSGGSYKMDRKENSLYFTGCELIKSFYMKDVMNVTDIESNKEELRIVGNKLVSRYDSSNFLVNVNPETSWYQNSSGVKIEHFKTFGRINHKDVFQTEDNKIWVYSDEIKSFVELVQYVKSGKKDISCTLISVEGQAYQCPTFAKQFSCKVPVYSPYVGQTSSEVTAVRLLNNTIRLDDTSSDNRLSDYYINLPQGQVIGFHKKRFGKLEPSKMTKDGWHKIRWSEDGSCWLGEF